MEESPEGKGECRERNELRRFADVVLDSAPSAQPPMVAGFDAWEKLADGGFGEVWKARWTEHPDPVAVKIGIGADPGSIARIQMEAEALESLDHPNIVRLLAVEANEGEPPWLAMEYIDGATLTDILPVEGFDKDEALGYFMQVLPAVQAAHESGVIHRDLKPSNVLVSESGVVKVADFGLAMSIEQRRIHIPLTMSGVVAGTMEYLAPECFHRGAKPSISTDIYSLGVILYELLVGSPPRGAWVRASQLRRIDIRYDDIIARAMNPEPELRFGSVREMEEAILRVESAAPRYAGTPRLTPAVRVADFLWSCAGLFCFQVGLATYFYLDREAIQLPLGLFNDHPMLLSGWLAGKTLLPILGVMGVWQCVRLWRFRRVELRESLPSPFGLVLGEGRTAAALVATIQAIGFLLPLFLAMYFILDLRWYAPELPGWQHVLRIDNTSGERSGLWEWSALTDGKTDWLREMTVDSFGDKITEHENGKVEFYPGFDPMLMVIGTALALMGGVAATLAMIAGWWDRKRRVFLVTGVVLGLVGSVWGGMFWLEMRRRAADAAGKKNHHDMSYSDEASIAVFLDSALAVLDSPATRESMKTRLRYYGEEVVFQGKRMKDLDALGDLLFERSKDERRKGFQWVAVGISHEKDGERITRAYDREFFSDGGPGIAKASGGMERVEFDCVRGADGTWKIVKHTIWRRVYYEADGGRIDPAIAERWVQDFARCLESYGCAGLEGFFNDEIFATGSGQNQLSMGTLVAEIRAERANWSELKIELRVSGDPALLAGSRLGLLLTGTRKGVRLDGERRAESVRWAVELVPVEGKWRVVRLGL